MSTRLPSPFEAATLLFSCLVAFSASATDVRLDEFEAAKAPTLQGAVDYTVPESPAFVALGLTPEEVTRPGTPKEFGSSLLTLVDREGNFQTGVAIEVAPWIVFQNPSFTVGKYRESGVQRFLSRAQLSLATTKGLSNDDESQRLSAALRVTPWSLGDPLTDYELDRCFDEVDFPAPGEFKRYADYQAAKAKYDDNTPGATEVEKKTNECLDASQKRLSGASGFDLGIAPTWIQEQKQSDQISWGGGTLWASLALRPLDFLGDANLTRVQKHFAGIQMIFHGRGQLSNQVADGDVGNGFRREDTILAGARIRQTETYFPFSIEGSFLYENPDNENSERSGRVALTTDLPVASQVWLNLAVGGTFSGDDNRLIIGATLKWGGFEIDADQVADLF